MENLLFVEMWCFLSLTIIILLSTIGSKNSSEEVIDYKSISPINTDSSVNMIVEIPSWTSVKDLDDLDIYYPGTNSIVATFFQNYKGKGQMKLKGWAGKSKALEILSASISSEKY